MPEISKCPGNQCPVKNTCWRYTSLPSEMQCYFIGNPDFNNQCDFYYDDSDMPEDQKIPIAERS